MRGTCTHNRALCFPWRPHPGSDEEGAPYLRYRSWSQLLSARQRHICCRGGCCQYKRRFWRPQPVSCGVGLTRWRDIKVRLIGSGSRLVYRGWPRAEPQGSNERLAGANGALGVFTKVAVKLAPWYGPPRWRSQESHRRMSWWRYQSVLQLTPSSFPPGKT